VKPKDADGVLRLCFILIQDYCFFIGRFELQYPHEADCAPVHFTSAGRTGAPQCGPVPGNKSVQWMGFTVAADGDIGNYILDKPRL